ncbi:MAG: NAD(P)/FAD-dependent oxidoreductase [Rikenellaceae bacterium]|nr:NAD(P)/FAD-dependent oxidoreductase [Rikenellaceae bacterium]
MKINIIGGGISGLTLGCYLQMYGFQTEIFEKNMVPGGLCATWKRGGYTFDGCIHWVLGSGEGSAFHRLWSELIDMKSVEFITHETCLEIELKNNRDKYGNKIFRLYTDIRRLERYLLDIAPEDRRRTKKIVALIRTMQKYEMPPLISEIPELQTYRQKMRMIKYLPFVWQYIKWRGITNLKFAKKLRNPFLKEAFELLYDGEEVNLLVTTMPLAFYDKKSAGYPIGGSAKFAERFEERYRQLGGIINYNKEVSRIVVENDGAKALEFVDGSIAESDVIISAADWYFTVYKALEGKYINDDIEKLASLKVMQLYPSVLMVSLGVARSFENSPHFSRFPLSKPYRSPDGTEYERMEVHIYNYDPTFAPEGKTSVTMSLFTRNGAFWVNLRNSDRKLYEQYKGELAANMIDELDQKLGDIKDKIEMTDVATPATYQRYTGNWQGSAQGWFPGSNLTAKSPVGIELPGLKKFYYTSQWSIPGGGLPSVLKASHDLAQKLMLKYKS